MSVREFDLIRSIQAANDELGQRVLLGPGDDLGMLDLAGASRLLAGVDQLIAGVHVRDDEEPEAMARKVLYRSLSDVAAMAGLPIGALVACTLPSDTPADWGQRFAKALRAAARAVDCPVFGGDIAIHKCDNAPLVASATVLAVPGDAANGRVVTRSGAQVGDSVWVSGCFGRSLLRDGAGHHLDFEPRIKLALRLHDELGEKLRSMIDVSDGLLADIQHVARASGVRMELNGDMIPRRAGASLNEALADGEDYELAFTVAASAAPPEAIDGVALRCIGSVQAGEGVAVTAGGQAHTSANSGWEHGQ